MYTANADSWKRTFPEGRVYPLVERDAPPENEHSSIGAVRFRLPFTAPQTKHLRNVRSNRKGEWHTDNNVVFDVFFSVPAPILSDRHAKCRDLVIIFQGTNETRPWNAYLYDRLGESLAQRNIASILLPTPFHLNRSAQEIKDYTELPSWSALTEDLVTPTEKAELASPFADFYQTEQEVNRLGHLIRNAPPNKDPWRVYHKLFDKGTRISLVGYSMGGLRALMLFLKDQRATSRFHRCVLLSSGGTLPSLQPPDVGDKKWKSYLSDVQHVKDRDLEASLGDNALAVVLELNPILFADDLGGWKGVFMRRAKEILLVLGTDDPMTESASRRMLGAELHTIARMTDKLGEDIQFELRYFEIIDMIVRFLAPPHRDPESRPTSREDLREEIRMKLVDRAGVSLDELTRATVAEKIWALDDSSLKEDLMDLYLMSKARFGRDTDLIASIRRHEE